MAVPLATLVCLAMNAVAVLERYVAKGARGFASCAGEDAANRAGELLRRTRARFAGDPEAVGSLACFERHPVRYRPFVQDIMRDKMGQDADFAAAVRALLDDPCLLREASVARGQVAADLA